VNPGRNNRLGNVPGSSGADSRSSRVRSALTNHRELPNVDGRSASARRFRDIVTAIASDQGGLEYMAEARLQLIRRFAALAVHAEVVEARLANGEKIDMVERAQLSSTLVRIASRIGIDGVLPADTANSRRFYTERCLQAPRTPTSFLLGIAVEMQQRAPSQMRSWVESAAKKAPIAGIFSQPHFCKRLVHFA
jgi:hypothetical protein